VLTGHYIKLLLEDDITGACVFSARAYFFNIIWARLACTAANHVSLDEISRLIENLNIWSILQV